MLEIHMQICCSAQIRAMWPAKCQCASWRCTHNHYALCDVARISMQTLRFTQLLPPAVWYDLSYHTESNKLSKVLYDTEIFFLLVNQWNYSIHVYWMIKGCVHVPFTHMRDLQMVTLGPGADSRMVRIGTAPPPLLTDKSCKFSLF